MIREKGRRNIIYTIILAMLLAAFFTVTVMAKGISEEDSAGIYSGSELYSPSAVADFASWFTSVISHVADDITGATLGTLLVLLGDGFYLIFSGSGVTITSVIYGRVGGALTAMNNNNVFSFEMMPGNFYGITAMAVYSQIRNVFILIMVCVVLWHMVAFIYTGGGQRERVRLIESTKRVVVVTLLLLVLPWLIDLFLYVRDSILYAEMVTSTKTLEAFADSLGVGGFSFQESAGIGGGADVAKVFRAEVSNDPSFMNALAYFASVLGCIYFYGVYVGYAITMVVLVIFFPFACALELAKPGMLADWVKQLLGIIMIPVIDAALLLLPQMCGIANSSGSYLLLSFVELVMIWAIVPARGLVRQWLGLGNGNALEMSGIGAIMGVARLATTAGRTIADPASGIVAMSKRAESDHKMSSMYMAKAQRADELSDSGARDTIRDMGAGIGDDPEGRGILSEAGKKLETVTGETSAEKAANRQKVISDAVKDLGRSRGKLQAGIDAKTEKMSELKTQAARSRARNEFLMNRVKSGESSDPEKDMTDAAAAREMAAQYEVMAASEQADIAADRQRINALERGIRDVGGGRAGGFGGGSAGGAGIPSGPAGSPDFPDIDNFADIDNFEMPDMRGISYERRAELLRQRAQRTERTAATKAVTAFAGGTIGLGAGMFGGQNMSLMTTAIGMEAGAYAAPGVSDGLEGIRTKIAGTSQFQEAHSWAEERAGQASETMGQIFEKVESVQETVVQKVQTKTRREYDNISEPQGADAAGASGEMAELKVDDRVLDQVVTERVQRRTQRLYEGGRETHAPADDVSTAFSGPEEKELYIEMSQKVIENVRAEYERAVSSLNSTMDGAAANDSYRQAALESVINMMPQMAEQGGVNLQSLDAAGWQTMMAQATAAYSANYAGHLLNESHLVPEEIAKSQGSLAAFTMAAYESVLNSHAEMSYVENALAKMGIARPK